LFGFFVFGEEFSYRPSLIGGLEHEFHFSIQLGMSSSQLTFTPSFFRGVGEKPPTTSAFQALLFLAMGQS